MRQSVCEETLVNNEHVVGGRKDVRKDSAIAIGLEVVSGAVGSELGLCCGGMKG